MGKEVTLSNLQLIRNSGALINLFKHASLPAIERIVNTFAVDSLEFRRLVPGNEELVNLVGVLSNRQLAEKIAKENAEKTAKDKTEKKAGDKAEGIVEELFNVLIQDRAVSRRLITCSNDLLRLAKIFPKPAEKLFNALIQNLAAFQLIVPFNDDLLRLAEAFPKSAENLFNLLLNNPDEFQRLISCKDDLENIKQIFPQQAARLSNHADKLWRTKHDSGLSHIQKAASAAATSKNAILVSSSQQSSSSKSSTQSFLGSPKTQSSSSQGDLKANETRGGELLHRKLTFGKK